MKEWIKTGVGTGCGALLLVLLAGACRFESADSVARHVNIHVGGLYRNGNGRVVSRNTGAPIVHLNVIQDGSRLQAVDNNGQVFRGHIGQVTDTAGTNRSATFTLEGHTTAGAEGIISGTISVSGTTATMQGTWAEPALVGTVTGTAGVQAPEPGPDPDPDPDTDNNNDPPPNNSGVDIAL